MLLGEKNVATNFVCNKLKIKENKLFVETTPKIKWAQENRAVGQMLVDSKNIAFLYILDCEANYSYIIFQRNTWPMLKDNIKTKLPVFVLTDDGEVELINFYSELTFLISNIKDNPNYGEKMNEEVKRIFF